MNPYRNTTACRAAALGLLLPSASAAAKAADAPSFLAEIASILLPLALIIAALVVVLMFARRRYGLSGRDAPLSVLQVLPVGPRERIVLLQTRAGRVLAVGVCAQKLSLIAQLDREDVASQSPIDTHSAPSGTNSTTPPPRG